jgi:hypothetical protein
MTALVSALIEPKPRRARIDGENKNAAMEIATFLKWWAVEGLNF